MEKVTIGGDRLGSGSKQDVMMKSYDRSTHDLSYTWRSSMSAGTLVPFMSKVALPGDTWDIDLNCEVLTLPTVGPLFGSYKVQLDVFMIPIRLWNRQLHMNKLNIGRDMSQVKFPQLTLEIAGDDPWRNTWNGQTNPSTLLRYLGITGIGSTQETDQDVQIGRTFNAIPVLNYWAIFKQYYANKQEEKAYMIGKTIGTNAKVVPSAVSYKTSSGIAGATILNTGVATGLGASRNSTASITFTFTAGTVDVNTPLSEIRLHIGSSYIPIEDLFTSFQWTGDTELYVSNPTPQFLGYPNATTIEYNTSYNPAYPNGGFSQVNEAGISLLPFNLSNIDDIRSYIFEQNDSSAFDIDVYFRPYDYHTVGVNDGVSTPFRSMATLSQAGLAVKTYQSDLFNNWINTDWISGSGGINEISAVDTSGGSFTIDALNLASKVYKLLNRIAISGGTYDDWLNAVYTHDRRRGVEEPVYQGSLIRELAFQEVVSTAGEQFGTDGQPLGTLAGRGAMTAKNKGGTIKVKVDEPAYIMGIVSLTPRLDYSQGNSWDVNLRTMDDLHKPELDAIGFEDLITDQLGFLDTQVDDINPIVFKTVGKVPAWINYMTDVNKCFGDFADENKTMFMTLNRRYDFDPNFTPDRGISDLSTYIDPAKFNYVFADTALDSQNFWVQIMNKSIVRRKMSAKVIPNL